MNEHTQNWKSCLKKDPLGWLLEEDNPPVRYRTLTEIQDKPLSDPIVKRAKQTITLYSPFIKLFSSQRKNGCWINQDYYLPKSCGTFWILSVLADSGLTIENHNIRMACEYMFTHQRDNGSFCRRRKLPGKGFFREDNPDPCTHARIIHFLIHFGYRDDIRIVKAFEWLWTTHWIDDMWLCGFKNNRHGCLRATLDVLGAAALHPAYAQHRRSIIFSADNFPTEAGRLTVQSSGHRWISVLQVNPINGSP